MIGRKNRERLTDKTSVDLSFCFVSILIGEGQPTEEKENEINGTDPKVSVRSGH